MFEMFSGHWHARALDTHFNCCSFRLSFNVFQFSLLKMSRERESERESDLYCFCLRMHLDKCVVVNSGSVY